MDTLRAVAMEDESFCFSRLVLMCMRSGGGDQHWARLQNFIKRCSTTGLIRGQHYTFSRETMGKDPWWEDKVEPMAIEGMCRAYSCGVAKVSLGHPGGQRTIARTKTLVEYGGLALEEDIVFDMKYLPADLREEYMNKKDAFEDKVGAGSTAVIPDTQIVPPAEQQTETRYITPFRTK